MIVWVAILVQAVACKHGEEPADFAHMVPYAGPSFKVQYPGNWNLSAGRSDPGEFRIESPGGQCTLDVDVDIPAGNYRRKLETQIARRVMAMPEPEFSAVGEWGETQVKGCF